MGLVVDNGLGKTWRRGLMADMRYYPIIRPQRLTIFTHSFIRLGTPARTRTSHNLNTQQKCYRFGQHARCLFWHTDLLLEIINLPFRSKYAGRSQRIVCCVVTQHNLVVWRNLPPLPSSYPFCNWICCKRYVLLDVGYFNTLNPELNPICYLLALLGAHHFLHVSRIRVKSLTLRLLMSYIYGEPILDVSRLHTTTHHNR